MRINDKGKWEFMGGFNPVPVSFDFHVVAAPHAETVRVSYTVPKGKAGFISGFAGLVMSVVSPLPIGLHHMKVRLKRGDNPEVTIFDLGLTASNLFISNTNSINANIPLQPGDVVTAYTEDMATGGTVDYSLNVSITEFDF